MVGVAGGPKKCAWLKDEAGFDAVIDYKAEPDLTAAIAAACPKGVDILFDNVGNESIDRVLPLMRLRGRVVHVRLRTGSRFRMRARGRGDALG